jgi:hypothetical protein
VLVQARVIEAHGQLDDPHVGASGKHHVFDVQGAAHAVDAEGEHDRGNAAQDWVDELIAAAISLRLRLLVSLTTRTTRHTRHMFGGC